MIVITVARKPLSADTVASNVLEHGAGAVNIDASRIEAGERPLQARTHEHHDGQNCFGRGLTGSKMVGTQTTGRWPANLLLSEEAAAELDRNTKPTKGSLQPAQVLLQWGGNQGGDNRKREVAPYGYDDEGGVSRYFRIIEK